MSLFHVSGTEKQSTASFMAFRKALEVKIRVQRARIFTFFWTCLLHTGFILIDFYELQAFTVMGSLFLVNI